jgi:large subunit ribosomal protein L6
MSRIGKKPVKIKEGVEVSLSKDKVVFKGSQGEVEYDIPNTVEVSKEDDQLIVKRVRNGKQAKADHGTVRALLANMIEGVKDGYTKKLELVGMGYRASLEGKTLVMTLGWNHPVKVEPPEGIKFEVEGDNKVSVIGIDKQKVGLWAAKIRSIRKPEPYKGKGIRYEDEVVRRKTSKTVKEEE